MELAQALLLLWKRKMLVMLGVVVAVGVGFAGVHLLKKDGYATASTQMIVDSPQSPLGNAGASLDPFTARASVFADLMASHPAVVAIGEAAGVPANEIVAVGPSAVGGTTTVSPPPPSGPQLVAKYKLFFDQDPTVPTVEIYSQAPTTEQAVALANGAVTGFAKYLSTLESQTSIKTAQRISVHELGAPVGGAVDPGASKKIGAIVGLLVLLLWCGGILWVERLRRNIVDRKAAMAADDRTALRNRVPYELTEDESTLDLRARSLSDRRRRGARVARDRGASEDEMPDRVGALAEPSSAPDER